MQGNGKDSAEAGDEQLKWKLHIFQASSIQTLIEHFWKVCSVNGGVSREKYVQLNMGLQRSLVPDVEMEVMLESSNEDWMEDSPQNKPLEKDEFSLFLFELTALWCTHVTLSSYLLFLGTAFVWLTQPKKHYRGSLMLKEVESVNFFPEAFFELLALAPQEDERWAEMDEEQRFGMWYLQNFGREQETLVLIQRQVFAITHDVRAVFLFNRTQSHDFLSLVKKASLDLTRIFPPDACLMQEFVPLESPKDPKREAYLTTTTVDTPRAQAPATPKRTRQTALKQTSGRKKMLPGGDQTELSKRGPLFAILPRRILLARPGATSPIPVVRKTQKSSQEGFKNVDRAGEMNRSSASFGDSPGVKEVTMYSRKQAVENTTRGSFSDSVKSDKKNSDHPSQDKSNNMLLCGTDYLKTVCMMSMADKRVSPSPILTPEPSVFTSLPSKELSSVLHEGVAPCSPTHQSWKPLPTIWTESARLDTPQRQREGLKVVTPGKLEKRRRLVQSHPEITKKVDAAFGDFLKSQVQVLTETLDRNDVVDKYSLPKRPREVYHNQVRPFMKGHSPIPPPSPTKEISFGKVVARMCYKDRIGKVPGPWAAPSDPLWNELDHNLTKILGKARKRMMRRRRRLLKTKLFRPQAPPQARRLRSFLNKGMEPGIGPYLEKAISDNAQL